MAGGEAPEKVLKANNTRWREYGKMVRMERKIQKKILDQGPPSQSQAYPQHSPGDTPWNGAERATLAKPRTVEGAAAAWGKDQLPQGHKAEGQKHKNHARRSREDV